MTIQAADRYEDLLTEADELMLALRGALNAAAEGVRPDWGHVGTLADSVVMPLYDALRAARALAWVECDDDNCCCHDEHHGVTREHFGGDVDAYRAWLAEHTSP